MPMPTIFVGLGGTGTQIALKLRASILSDPAMARDIDTLFQFVCIDTDRCRIEELQSHTLNLGANADQIYGLLMRKCRNKDDVEFLRWWDCEWLRRFPIDQFDLSQGCRMLRRFGRLCLYRDFLIGKGMSRVNGVLKEAKESALYYGAHSIHSNSLLVVICSSLCGGTGSGMLLDIAYWIYNNFNHINLSILGVLLAPELYQREVKDRYRNLKPNAYATIKEIQYYRNSEYRFEPLTEGRSIQNADPFNTYWLVQDEMGERRTIVEQFSFVASELLNLLAHENPLVIVSDHLSSQPVTRQLFSTQRGSFRDWLSWENSKELHRWKTSYTQYKMTSFSPHISREMDH